MILLGCHIIAVFVFWFGGGVLVSYFLNHLFKTHFFHYIFIPLGFIAGSWSVYQAYRKYTSSQ